MSKIDLDEAQRLCERGNATVLLPLVAELRAARDVIAKARLVDDRQTATLFRLRDALAAYDKITGENQ